MGAAPSRTPHCPADGSQTGCGALGRASPPGPGRIEARHNLSFRDQSVPALSVIARLDRAIQGPPRAAPAAPGSSGQARG